MIEKIWFALSLVTITISSAFIFELSELVGAIVFTLLTICTTGLFVFDIIQWIKVVINVNKNSGTLFKNKQFILRLSESTRMVLQVLSLYLSFFTLSSQILALPVAWGGVANVKMWNTPGGSNTLINVLVYGALFNVLTSFSSDTHPVNLLSEACTGVSVLVFALAQAAVVPYIIKSLIRRSRKKDHASERPRGSVPRLWPLTSVPPIIVYVLFLLCACALLLLVSLSPILTGEWIGTVFLLLLVVLFAAYVFVLFYRRLFVGMIDYQSTGPLYDGDVVVKSRRKWIETAIAVYLGALLLTFLIMLSTVRLEAVIHSGRTHSVNVSNIRLSREPGTLWRSTVRLAYTSVLLSGGAGFGQYQPSSLTGTIIFAAVALFQLIVSIGLISIAIGAAAGVQLK